ncbi:hypothetical protein E2562_013208, partial [Oryza meyeriana var. granulata]
ADVCCIPSCLHCGRVLLLASTQSCAWLLLFPCSLKRFSHQHFSISWFICVPISQGKLDLLGLCNTERCTLLR